MKEQQIFTPEQRALKIELVTTYGLDPEEIIFFSADADPFFGFEACCILCNKLADLHDINTDLPASQFPDSVPVKVSITLADGKTRSSVGVANKGETDGDGNELNSEQIFYLACGRGLRNVLRIANIDLVKLHRERTTGVVEPQFSGSPLSNYDNLLRQVHVLGQEADLIIGDDKGPWRKIIMNRYGVWHSNELNEEQLADFAAVLRTLVPQVKAAA